MACIRIVLGLLVVVVNEPVVAYAVKYQAAVQPHKLSIAISIFLVVGFPSLHSIVRVGSLCSPAFYPLKSTSISVLYEVEITCIMLHMYLINIPCLPLICVHG